MSEVISSFKSLRAGSQVFALLMLFLCVILHDMWSGKSLQLSCILPFCMLCLSAISMMFVKITLAVSLLPLHRTAFGGMYDGFTPVRKSFLDYRRVLTGKWPNRE